MSRDNFAACLAHTLRYEGGYVNNPLDPGGKTNKGITQRTYDGWRSKQGLYHRDVRFIDDKEVQAIYRRDYWDAVKGDDLRPGVDLAVFDYAVNSGVGRALTALKLATGLHLADSVCDQRMAFLRGLRTFPTFGKGWTARVKDVRTVAATMK